MVSVRGAVLVPPARETRPVQGDGDQAVTLTVAGFRGCPYARDASLNGWRCSSIAKHRGVAARPFPHGGGAATLVWAIFSASSSSRALRQIGHSQSSPPPSTNSDGRGPAAPRLHFRAALASRSSFARRWMRSHRRRPAWISIPQYAHLFGAASGFGGTGGCVRADAGRATQRRCLVRSVGGVGTPPASASLRATSSPQGHAR
jgi:hypothetical protein